jgi:RHS repeat-associated protein
MEYAYTSNATGEITSQSFLNTQNLKLETSTTQTDWAGRILQTAKGTITQTYVYHDNTAPAGSRGQLKSVMDSDNVTTLHAYNGRGERTTTALKLGNETTITPGIDQITISETVPALGVGDIPVWRTISKVSYTSVLSPIVSQTDRTPDGTVHEIKGDQTYRVQYGYDYAARMQTMTTFGTETAATTWFYNQATGLLDRKEYHDGNGTSYKYTLGGRLAKRTWQRGVVTDYHYDSGGRQRAIDYSDDTPDVLYTHDAIGRILNEKQGTLSVNSGVPVVASPVRAISYTHDPSTLLPQSETHALGGLIRTLVRSHDGVGRPEKVAAGIDANSDPATLETTDHYTGYFFGTDGRLLGIDAKDLPRFAQKDYGIEYTYSAQSDHLIHTLTRAGSGGAANLVTTHTWDPTRDVLFIKDNRLDAAQDPFSRYDYSNHVNGIGQREKVVTSGTAFGGTNRGWSWGYDKRGQVTVASHGADSELDRSYLFDGIGNRLETTVGDSTAVTTEYDPTPLNQYSSITIGTNNPLAPVHDPDGNLTEDAAHNKNNDDRQYVWDAENRLIAVNKVTGRDETSGEITATSSLVTYAYDSRSRRISRSVGVSPTSTTFYLYDGWNVVAEYTDNGVDPLALNRTYTWGTDLSSSLQGAGGVGGLLAVRVHGGDHAGNYYPTFDGNGNVSEYLTDGGILKAHHEYDPFGNDVTPETAKGDLHGFFSHRFSTKPFDDISGWSYYGYRYYDPVTGRWPSRDPIGEEGGMNLYGFVGNSTIHRVEKLGLHAVDLKLQNAPGYRCSGNFLWAAYAAFFTGLSPSTDYFASYTYTVGYSNTTCSGSTWGWTDLGERTITQRFSTRAGMTKATDTRITPINQGMAAGDRGWATPSIPIDDGRVVIYLKFAIRLYKSNADIATLNLHRPMPNGGPYKSGFDGNNPSDSLSWFNDAFGYGANHSSGFLNSPIPSSAVVVASGTNRLEMHLCCCGTKDDYGNYKARPALEIHDRVSQAFEVPDGVRMKPRK